jgi:hypothetical protein
MAPLPNRAPRESRWDEGGDKEDVTLGVGGAGRRGPERPLEVPGPGGELGSRRPTVRWLPQCSGPGSRCPGLVVATRMLPLLQHHLA